MARTKKEVKPLEMWRCPVSLSPWFRCPVQFPADRPLLQDSHIASEHLEYFQERMDRATEKLVHGSRRDKRLEWAQEAIREGSQQLRNPVSSVATFPPENTPEGHYYALCKPFVAPLGEIAEIDFKE